MTQLSRPAWSLIWCVFLCLLASRPFVSQAPGLIAVGQRLAPLSEARTSFRTAKLSPIFLPDVAQEGCRTMRCAGVPAFEENPAEFAGVGFLLPVDLTNCRVMNTWNARSVD